jgi:hypothetical protein
MTGIFILAMTAGLVVLGYMPLPKDKLVARTSQGAGAVLFAVGLGGVIWSLLPQLA